MSANFCWSCGAPVAGRVCARCGSTLRPVSNSATLASAALAAMLLLWMPGFFVIGGFLGGTTWGIVMAVAGATAVAFGAQALGEIKRDPTLRGRGRAITAVALGALVFTTAISMLVWWLGFHHT